MLMSYRRQIALQYTADVFVAGGGPAGVAAAVAAARNGKRVILAEQSGSLGGASVLAMVPELMNFGDGKHFLCGGIGREVFEALMLSDGNSRKWHAIKAEPIKYIYDAMVAEAGVKVLFYTRLVDVIVEDGAVCAAIVSGAEGLFAIQAELFVDCTGSGALCAMAGNDWAYGDKNGMAMSATLCSLWGGIDYSIKKPDTDIENYQRAYADGIFSQYDTALPGIKECYPEIGVGGGNIGHCFGVNDLDTESLSAAMQHGRKLLREYERYYREYVPGCEHIELIRSADYMGIRESRRIQCLYMLSETDYFSAVPFADEIGRYSYPIDIHPLKADQRSMTAFMEHGTMRHGDGESYSIPYRSLVPRKLKNVLVAGRCIGTDHIMQSSLRVIPCCYITGQAAGAAAAVCADHHCSTKELDVDLLRKALRQLGAYLAE